MSKLDELIQKLSPNGVEYKKIIDVASVSIGEFVHKNKQNPNGKYPVYNGGISNTGYYDDYNMDENKIIISARGANAGFVNLVLTKYWAGNSCYSVDVKRDDLDFKFVYYFLKNNELKLIGEQQKGGIPAVSKKQVEEFKIPVPPREVQDEIVRVLDNFTELTSELTSELTARKQQYEYYKKELFNSIFVEKLVKLDDISNIITKQTGFDYSTTIKPSLITEKREGYLPFVQNKDFEGLSINFETDYYVPEKIANKFPRITLDTESLLISISGKIGNVGLFTNQQKAFIGGAICVCKLQKLVNAKYIMYYLMSSHGQKQLFMSVKAASHLNITVESIRNLTIPLPSFEEQQRIVDILDKFNTYCNDLTQGLPAEIELRKQQYEYYRDKLLSFKELK